jgi:hypothetical protein
MKYLETSSGIALPASQNRLLEKYFATFGTSAEQMRQIALLRHNQAHVVKIPLFRMQRPPRSYVLYSPIQGQSLTGVTWVLTQKVFSPPAGRKIPFFFTKMLHNVQHFCNKEKTSTMLPQANRASIA